ncbi:AAA domain-containing protein [Microdochium trichocladiopsis]|uniref:AAA domain-containing protein n=1 Tax=Microdochium trichocladiopsis TaxID=1682393 RepID=A0A9P8XWA9_9PEZI|nr:AAA domain-containing protein [Microdochium trichocladiopsis]KAH7016266.1 AAA domain-containing protein [Microdochium trichocladiopsis]
MQRNIYIIGAQSTGKSTIVSALEDHFTNCQSSTSIPPSIVREVARGVMSKQQDSANEIARSPEAMLELQGLIIKAQAIAERKVVTSSSSAMQMEEAPPFFISDRSAIDPIVYARQYVGPRESEQLMSLEDWQLMCKRMACSLIVVCEADVSWLTQDGVRLMPSTTGEWLQTQDLFRQILKEVSLPFVVLPKELTDIADRVAFVVKHWRSSSVTTS